MNLQTLIQNDTRMYLLAAGQLDVETILFRHKAQAEAAAISIRAQVSRQPIEPQREDRGRTNAHEMSIAFGVASADTTATSTDAGGIQTPALGDMVKLPKERGGTAVWMELTERLSQDNGCHHFAVGR